MFIGHFGLGFGAKKINNRPSLGTLFMAAQWLDLIWPIMLILGIERVEIQPGNTVVAPLNFVYYPYTHGLFFVLIWSLLFGLVYYLFKKDAKTAFFLGILVLSHWVLDFITHGPDLSLFPWMDKKVGLGLWNSFAGTIIVEVAIYAIGVYMYYTATKAKNKTGIYSFWILVAFLFLIHMMNLFGPPPTKVEPLAYAALIQWLIILWGYWIDKNRVAV